MNPFKYGEIVQGPFFCPRPELTRILVNHIHSCQNTLIEGERRIGKTSLVMHAISKSKKKCMFIDLYHIKTLEDLCRRMAKALILKESNSTKFMKAIAHLRPKLTINPATGEPSLGFDRAYELHHDSVESLLDLMANRNAIVFFDEFQDILKVEDAWQVMAVMRSRIQFHSKIPYFFAGSVRNDMNRIFNDSESPFFKSAATISVGSIEQTRFAKFLGNRFEKTGRPAEPGLVKDIMKVAGDLPGDIQQLCAMIWDATPEGQTINAASVEIGLERVFRGELKAYEAIMEQVTGHQLNCLRQLAAHPDQRPYSAAFLRGSGIAQASSVGKAIKRLVDLRIIHKTNHRYRFVNPFFREWLNRRQI